MVKYLSFTLLFLGCLAAAQDRYRIDTFAGTPAPEGVSATSSFLTSPQGIAVDSAGNLYIGVVNQWRVKRVDVGTTIIHTVAGNGIGSNSGDNGPALQAGLGAPRYVALNAAGDMFISEGDSCVVRKVDHATHVITTYAGNGTCGFSGDSGSATSAQLNWQRGIAVDSAGNLYIADYLNQRVRRVDAVAPHVITTVAGADPSSSPPYGDGGLAANASLSGPFGVAFDSGGDLYILDKGHCAIRRVNLSTSIITTYAGTGTGSGHCGYYGDGGPATAAILSNSVRGMAFGPGDTLFLSDAGNLRVRVVARSGSDPGNIDTYAGNGSYGYQADTRPAANAQVAQPEGLAVDSNGDLYIADWNANAIGKITPGTTPMFSLYAGSLGPEGVATSAFLNRPEGLAVKSTGDVLISDSLTGRVRAVNTSGVISTVAGVGMTGPYQACSVPTNCFLGDPMGLAADDAGAYYFTEFTNCVIRKVDSSNNMTVVAGTGVCGLDNEVGPATNAKLWGVAGISVASAFNPANGRLLATCFLQTMETTGCASSSLLTGRFTQSPAAV
ncbi:MAG: hypothetical protein ABSC08_09585 [Bryobacteraceae bacterium]|jgi:sugar lactone lactonase YvrE